MGKTNETNRKLVSMWDAPSTEYNWGEKLGLWLLGFKYELGEEKHTEEIPKAVHESGLRRVYNKLTGRKAKPERDAVHLALVNELTRDIPRVTLKGGWGIDNNLHNYEIYRKDGLDKNERCMGEIVEIMGEVSKDGSSKGIPVIERVKDSDVEGGEKKKVVGKVWGYRIGESFLIEEKGWRVANNPDGLADESYRAAIEEVMGYINSIDKSRYPRDMLILEDCTMQGVLGRFGDAGPGASSKLLDLLVDEIEIPKKTLKSNPEFKRSLKIIRQTLTNLALEEYKPNMDEINKADECVQDIPRIVLKGGWSIDGVLHDYELFWQRGSNADKCPVGRVEMGGRIDPGNPDAKAIYDDRGKEVVGSVLKFPTRPNNWEIYYSLDDLAAGAYETALEETVRYINRINESNFPDGILIFEDCTISGLITYLNKAGFVGTPNAVDSSKNGKAKEE